MDLLTDGFDRRHLLKAGLIGGAAVMLPFSVARAGTFTGSGGAGGTSPTFTPFQQTMPVPTVLAPVTTDATTDYYNITMSANTVEIIPNYQTQIWGYNGLYPGPTIAATSGRRVVVRQTNNLTVPTTVHTHGAYVDGDSDGHPDDQLAPGASKTYIFSNNQNARTQWYHDHAEHRTATNVYQGLAGFYLIRDDFEASLPLPTGVYDVPIVIQDRSFNADGSLLYPANAVSDAGLMGDVIVVNGVAQPRFEVANRRYRLRLLNGSNARPYQLSLSSGNSFQVIATEGGLLASPLTLTSLTIWPAERYEIVVDFGKEVLGTSVVLNNALGTGALAQVMRFDVTRQEVDTSSVPSVLRPAAAQVDNTHLTPGPVAVTRTFDFQKTWDGIYVINGMLYDQNRIDAAPRSGDTEIWELTTGWGWSHPVHIHLINFKILDRNGQPPTPQERGWKETVVLHPNDRVRVQMTWPQVPLGPTPGNFTYRYVFHCHNLGHEDHDMMAQIKVTPT